MDLNFLQRLGIIPPANGYGDPGVPPYAPVPANPIAPGASRPVNLLEGTPYDPQAAPPAAAPAVADPQGSPGINLLQQLNQGVPANAVPSSLPEASGPTRPARARSSAVDILGRLSDVFAKVGGADALYQPTLDARQDRGIALADHDRSVDLEKLKLATAQGEFGDAGNARLGQAIRGLQAIQAANPNADISKIFPLLAQQAGVDPARAAALGQQIAENPELLKGLAGTVGATKEFGLQPFYAKDASGNLTAYQLSKDGTIQPVALPDGTAPIDPLKFVDTGGTMTGVGTRSGGVARILPKTEKPGGAADRAARIEIANSGNASRERIAAMPARAKPGAAADKPGGGNPQAVAAGNIDELERIYDKLNAGGGIVSTRNSTGSNVLARLRSSGGGQMLEGAVGTEAQTLRDRIGSIRPGLMQSIAKAAGMTSKQLDSNADVKLFMQTVTDPTKSYEANKATIAGLRRFLAANRVAPAAGGGGGARPAPRAPASRAPVRARGAGKPSVSNW